MGRNRLSQDLPETATALPLDEWRTRIVGLVRAPASKLARVFRAFVRDGTPYRVSVFYHSLPSLAEEDLFEAIRCYHVAWKSDAWQNDEGSDEAIHLGLNAIRELNRRYSLDPDLGTEKYFEWLDATGRYDPGWLPAARKTWRKITEIIRQEEKGTLH